MCLFQFPRMALPQTAFDHPPPHRLFTDLDVVTLGQLLARKRRPEIVPVGLLEELHHALLCLFSEIRRFDVFPRNAWITTPSPCFSMRASSFRTHRSVTPIFSAAFR